MSRVHGWTALVAVGAAAVVLAPAVRAAGAPAAQVVRRAPAKPQAALATGTSSDRSASFSLEGRRLTVQLKRPLARRTAVVVRCGDGVAESWRDGARVPFARLPRFAAQGGRRVVLAARTGVVRATLSRDVVAQATYCGLEATTGASTAAPAFAGAWMTLRRGTAAPCRPARRQTIVFQSATALVIQRVEDDSSEYYAATLSACLRPAGRMLDVGAEWSGGGGGGGSARPGGFASAGRWLAWSSEYRPNSQYSQATAGVSLLDLGASGGSGASARAVSFLAGADDTVYPTASVAALTSSGTVVWLASTRAEGSGPYPYVHDISLHVSRPDGSARELDRVTPGGTLTAVAVSEDGRTVTWRNGRVLRSATL